MNDDYLSLLEDHTTKEKKRIQEERQQLNNIIKKSESEIDKLLDKKSECIS